MTSYEARLTVAEYQKVKHRFAFNLQQQLSATGMDPKALLSKCTSLKAAHIANYLAARSIPVRQTLEQLAAALGCTTDDLVPAAFVSERRRGRSKSMPKVPVPPAVPVEVLDIHNIQEVEDELCTLKVNAVVPLSLARKVEVVILKSVQALAAARTAIPTQTGGDDGIAPKENPE